MKSPTCFTERLFLQSAVVKLPMHAAEISRNSYGLLCFKWVSPCPELEALWISVTSAEIVLSCAIAHAHIAGTSYSIKEKLTNRKSKRRIVRDGIRQASQFLDGQIAATITYDEFGKRHSYGWCPRKQLTASLEYTRKVFGQGMTERAWVWSGEVEVT